jgi:hypothetical protein
VVWLYSILDFYEKNRVLYLVCAALVPLFDLVPLDLKNAYVLHESADSSSCGRRSADFSFVSLVCAFFLIGFLCRFCPAGFLSVRQDFCF